MKKVILSFFLIGFFFQIKAQKVDFSVVQVNEESGINFTKISSDNDYVCMPIVNRTSNRINWLSNRILDISNDGLQIAYLSARNNTTNIFIKDLSKQGSSLQRTNRQAVLDFTYSPDGKYILFSEANGKLNQIFQTDANKGYVCRQITNGNQDYSPIYSEDIHTYGFNPSAVCGISGKYSLSESNELLSHAGKTNSTSIITESIGTKIGMASDTRAQEANRKT